MRTIIKCLIADRWRKEHPNLSVKKEKKKLKKYMKTHCMEDRSCFLCPMLEIRRIK